MALLASKLNPTTFLPTLRGSVLIYWNLSAYRCEFLLRSMGREFVSSVQESFASTPPPVSHKYFVCSEWEFVVGKFWARFSCGIFREIPGIRWDKGPLLTKVSAVLFKCCISSSTPLLLVCSELVFNVLIFLEAILPYSWEMVSSTRSTCSCEIS